MKVKKVYLENFLSYENLFVEFGEGLNVLIGDNAMGKTNLLESIYFSSVGKSARGLKDKELIKWNSEKSARIRLCVEKKYSSHIIDIAIDTFGKKRITIDNLPISKIGELMGAVNVVYFSPEEMRLIKESPSDRRRFMDISLCQQDKIYFYTLIKYNKLLAQRNKLLKEYSASPSLKDMSDIITDKMCECQEYIITKRRKFISKIAPIANERHSVITSGKESLSVEYETETDGSDIKKDLLSLYEKNYEKDKRLQYTTVGVHRDDLKIVAGGIDIRKYGSQGQQRTTALSMKIAEVFAFYDVCGEFPILLMDDVLSELDESRRRELLSGLDGVQTFVTCTDFNENVKNKSVYHIRNGTVHRDE